MSLHDIREKLLHYLHFDFDDGGEWWVVAVAAEAIIVAVKVKKEKMGIRWQAFQNGWVWCDKLCSFPTKAKL